VVHSTSAAIALHHWRRISGTLVAAHVRTAPTHRPPRAQAFSRIRRGTPHRPPMIRMLSAARRTTGLASPRAHRSLRVRVFGARRAPNTRFAEGLDDEPGSDP
jgi:hypothetical protein